MRSIGPRGSGRLSAMGEAGRARVKKYFSFNAFASHLHDYITIATSTTTPYAPFSLGKLLGRLALAFHFGMAMILLFWMVFYTPLPY